MREYTYQVKVKIKARNEKEAEKYIKGMNLKSYVLVGADEDELRNVLYCAAEYFNVSSAKIIRGKEDDINMRLAFFVACHELYVLNAYNYAGALFGQIGLMESDKEKFNSLSKAKRAPVLENARVIIEMIVNEKN